MPTTRICGECGAPLPDDVPEGACPLCALRGALGVGEALPEAVVTEQPGDRIGRYKLLEKIGEGGHGVVYMAEQAEPIRRRVALKVIKLGMDTKQVVARFEAERQALALMDHPNIAKVLDAGATDTGRPYFVMELVRGIQITEYCDHHNLPTKERLDLFIQVCHAVQHAHQKGIIHRDLKPSNVLVTRLDGRPVPKVIDFGIAKATGQQLLTEKTLFTAFQQFIGTPAYMSPEQAEMSGADIDTRSDIYALGVLLYELLTGQVPFERQDLMQAGFDEMRRLIREQDPPRPSTRLSSLSAEDLTAVAKRRDAEPPKLIHLVRGDLDWIVMKCLEKDRARRYETTSGLADDLLRHLGNEPVSARPPSGFYRLQKMVRRNTLAFAAAAAVVTALTLGIIASTWQAVRATRAERQQERLYREAVAAKKAETAAKKDAVREKEAAEYQAYVANIATAGALMSAGEVRPARQHLSMCPERFRNWEWRYVDSSGDRSLRVIKGPAGGNCAATYSPDGSRIATGWGNGSIWVLNGVTGESILEWSGHRARVGAVAYSPDGKRIATASGGAGWQPGDNSARIWDASTGKQLTLLQHGASVNSVAWSQDGTRLVTAAGLWGREEDNSVRIWDAETGRELLCLRAGNGAVVSAAFSPDGRRIVTGEWANTGRVWDAVSGEQLLVLNGGPAEVLYSVGFSRDGTHIISGSTGSRSVHVWDAATGKELFRLQGHQSSVNSVAFSHDGQRIVAGEAGVALRVWDVAARTPLHLLFGHTAGISTVAFSPDDSRMVSASRDGTARVWHGEAGWAFPVLRGHKGTVCCAAFSPDDSRIVTACSSWANTSDRTAKIWDAHTGEVIQVLRGHTDSVNSAAFDPSGMRIVTASDDQTVRVWDAATGAQRLELRGHKGDISCAEFSPDGRRIVTASGGFYSRPPLSHGSDHTVRIWDAITGAELLVISSPDTRIHCAAFSPDGTKLAIATGVYEKKSGSAQVWDAVAGRCLMTLSGHKHVVFSVAWDRTGSRIITASWDGTARIWDSRSGKEVLQLWEHDGWVHRAAFCPDGSRVVTASNDKTVRVWDAVTGMQLLVLREHSSDVNFAEFSHDGTRIVSCSTDGTARVWDSVPRQQRYKALLAK
jgi:eukaryotic-like serine/threonine-protein kinase